MLKRVVALGLIVQLLAGSALAAPPIAGAEDPAFVQTMRKFGDITSGQLVGGGKSADKMLFFKRNDKGEVVLNEISVAVPGGSWTDPPTGAIAAMRTRVVAPNSGSAERADVEFAKRTGLPTFIVGEWSKPSVVRELMSMESGVHIREIDDAGRGGSWRLVKL